MLLSPRTFAFIAAAICLFFALSLSEKHIARIFDYKTISEKDRKATARSWRLVALGLTGIFGGVGSGRATLIVIGVILIFVAKLFAPTGSPPSST